eukprot:3737129-Prorocentrum_lima.AAC.1
MSYQRIALPLKMNVAVRFDVNNGGWAPSSLKRPCWRFFASPEFNLVADLVIGHLNCLTCFGSKSATRPLGC